MQFTSSKGVKWFLHSREIKNWGRGKITVKTYYFDHKSEDSIEVPNSMVAFETGNGMPMLKKI